MALVKLEELPVSDKASNLPSDVPLSQDAYSTRIKDAVFGMSKSSGRPMITLDCEIYSPDTIKSHYNGKTYTVAGISDKKYLSLGPDSLQYTLEFMRQIGLTAQIDPENPDVEQFKNRTWRNLWYAEEQPMNKPQSEEDKLAGKKPEPICKEDGTPIKIFRSKLGRYVGPTSAPLPAV